MLQDIKRTSLKNWSIWVISQLNRTISTLFLTDRLKRSGQIAEAADIVMFVYRPETYGKFFLSLSINTIQGKAMIDIAKDPISDC